MAHFKKTSDTKEQENPAISQWREEISNLHAQSLQKDDEELLLDVPFSLEQLEAALKRLKAGKSGGHDGLVPEHLKHGGVVLRTWLLQVYNAIIELEAIPSTLKLGIITPVYKGGGKDPLSSDSYRGITLTPVIAKLLETLLVERLSWLMMERGLPHLNQTGYRKKVSCQEAIFATLETIMQHAQKNEKMYLCMYDLQKAFDSVEYPLLFKRLHENGVNGKLWRIIQSWYNAPKAVVRVDQNLSADFTLHRGVLQGSVLSPALFLLIIDPLLRELDRKSLGSSICGLFLGAFAHADDIRTVTSCVNTLNQQIEVVQSFAAKNALTLNISKCEIVIVSPSTIVTESVCTLNEHPLVPVESAKCLGYWWTWNLSASKAIDEGIKKARRAFFAFGSKGAFQGNLNPIASREIFEVCVVPILLYGCENWALTDSLLHQLENFQGEIGRRILKLSRFHSTLASRIALKWSSMAARILLSKLSLLHKLHSEERHDTLGSQVFNCLAASDPHSISLVQECWFLEGKLECYGVTDQVLQQIASMRDIKKIVNTEDWKLTLSNASQHQSTKLAAEIATDTSWLKIWDMSLDHGPHAGTACMQALYRVLTRPVFGTKPCALCDTADFETYFSHYVDHHTSVESEEAVINCLREGCEGIFTLVKHFTM